MGEHRIRELYALCRPTGDHYVDERGHCAVCVVRWPCEIAELTAERDDLRRQVEELRANESASLYSLEKAEAREAALRDGLILRGDTADACKVCHHIVEWREETPFHGTLGHSEFCPLAASATPAPAAGLRDAERRVIE